MAATKTERPLRVLMVEDSLADNGAARIVLDFAEHVDHDAARVELFVLQPVRGARAVTPGPHLPVTRGVPDRGRIRTHGLAALRRLATASRRSDVVVSGSEVGLGLVLGFAVARAIGRPFAILVHAPLDGVLERWVPRSLRAVTRLAHRHADAAICVSRDVVESVLANGLEFRRAHLVPNGVDAARVRRLAQAGPAPTRSVATFVAIGRLSSEKRFDVLIRAHAELRADRVEHEVEIIGEGPDRAALEVLAAELDVADTLHLAGFQENPFPQLASAAALVVTSTLEGSPLAVLEALALGVPVIATRSSGAAALLGDHGEIVADSPTAVAAALRRRVELGAPVAGAPAQVRDFTEVAADYLAVFREAAGRRGRRSRARDLVCG